jgi:predicted NAD/FAD-dependent oxidoreductase
METCDQGLPVDYGAQFLRPSNPRFKHVLGQLEQHGLVGKWQGRFGILGSRGGGFLPQETVRLATQQRAGQKQENAGVDGGDFCDFIGEQGDLFVGIPSMTNVCEGICSAVGANVRHQTRVTSLSFDEASALWSVDAEAKGKAGTGSAVSNDEYDAVVLASHDASFGAGVVRGIVDTLVHDDPLSARLQGLAEALQAQRARKAPVFTLSASFDAARAPSTCLPFDAATCPTSEHIQLVSRENSKPGRAPAGPDAAEVWTAVSTSSFARRVLDGPTEGREAVKSACANELSRHMTQLFSPFYEAGDAPAPREVSVKRWGAGFAGGSLGLKEDCVSLQQWRVAICGDFLKDNPSPAEAAALSGMEAGERVASWFAP